MFKPLYYFRFARVWVSQKLRFQDFVKFRNKTFLKQVVVRTQETRRSGRDDRVREYFYGSKGNLYPHSFTVSFADIKIFKIGGEINKVTTCRRYMRQISQIFDNFD